MRTKVQTEPPDWRDLDDAALIERSLREPESFSLVYDRHAARIHRYVTRRLGDGLADDVVADTFLDAFRHRHRYRLDRPDARPWLYGIAANLIGKHRRAEKRMWAVFARTGTDLVEQSYADRIDERVSAGAAGDRIARALAAMSPKNREVLLLIAWADLSYAETAEALEISVGTVRSRLHRARKSVADALGGQNPTALEELSHE